MTREQIERVREILDTIRKSGFVTYNGDHPHVLACEALTLLDTLAKELEWQKIETAPRDGTPIILLFKDAKKVSVGWWSGNEQVGWGNNFTSNMNVSHYMPLPQPPKE